MKITQHPSNSLVIRAPKGFTLDECGPAPTTLIDYGYRTFWKPSEVELKLLNEGQYVMLEVRAPLMYPHYIGVME